MAQRMSELLGQQIVVENVGGAGGMVGSARVARSVSYTHLRAHETVLDLVCRLLLEKKKNIINKIKTKRLLLQKEEVELSKTR